MTFLMTSLVTQSRVASNTRCLATDVNNMAKFVLAGKADCPFYAKAELLADLLQSNLPDFRIYKICIHPDDWETWLGDVCASNGWEHESSPIVWRELIDHGGKGKLLGGFSDFFEYAQGYYGLTFDMGTELMLKIATENLQLTELLIEEEAQRKSRIKPFHIWISSALNPTCYNLISLLFTSGVFRDTPTISLHLLDTNSSSEEPLLGLKMETEDLCLPQLHEVTVHSDLTQAFLSANLILFLDKWSPDSEEQEEPDDKEREVSQVAEQFRRFGQLVEVNAQKDVKVMVAGDFYINLKCCLLIENVPSVDPRHFVAVSTQLETEARTQLAEKLAVKPPNITDVIVWGNISGSFFVDLQRAKVFQYKGAICGPKDFSQHVLEMIYDGKWVTDDFPNLVSSRRQDISLLTKKPASISAANGIIAVLLAWYTGSSPQKIFSLGVRSTGLFDLPDGLVFSLPVRFQDGDWSACTEVTINDELRSNLEAAVNDLMQERKSANRTMKIDPVV